MPNSLTAEAGLRLGPIVIETFFKHYLERNSLETKRSEYPGNNSLREQRLLWHETFEISFLNQATRHTVEELREFSNARIPVAPQIYAKHFLSHCLLVMQPQRTSSKLLVEKNSLVA
ncbi:hypothetical protein JB92DRAFT_3127046 [Gautieria morchelliformis]|nr:hypothetical protein JB92DRAFT_3127046 [Gautieria morchelliformis]